MLERFAVRCQIIQSKKYGLAKIRQKFWSLNNVVIILFGK